MNSPESGLSASPETTPDLAIPKRRQRGPNDPHRRDRIARAAVEVIAENGVDSLTHRKVAATAGVPLGSTTYHFANLEELLAAALDNAAKSSIAGLQAWADALDADADLAAALADYVIESIGERRRQTLAEYTLYVLALHRPHLQESAVAWDDALNDVLIALTDRLTGHMLGTLLCGLLMQTVLRTEMPGKAEVEGMFRSAIAGTASASEAHS